MKKYNSGKIEKNIHRSNIQRLLHSLCLLLPILAAFLGYYCAEPIWHSIKTTETPEVFKFFISILAFSVPTVLIFIFTRKSNSIIKIKISD